MYLMLYLACVDKILLTFYVLLIIKISLSSSSTLKMITKDHFMYYVYHSEAYFQPKFKFKSALKSV